MQARFFLLLCLLTAASRAAEHRYLYLSSPDAAQNEGRAGNGILIFDIDNGHRFVRHIEIPGFHVGLRGFTGSAKTGRIYYSTSVRGLGCFDVATEKVVWERTFDLGCDRSSITTDGKKIYVPTGWWDRGAKSGFLVVNAETGDVINRLIVGPQAHNSIVSLDGQFVFLGTETNLTMFSTKDDSVVKRFVGVGEAGVFPFTIDGRTRYAYVCLGKHVGFDIVDLKGGMAPHRVLAGDAPIPHRTHGVGLTPDESELWISDQVGKRLFIFDATSMPPKPKTQVSLSQGGHGWVAFSLDGRYAWCHTPDVFDVKTKQLVATLKDAAGRPVSSSKFIEVHLRDGQVVDMGNEFGLGRRVGSLH